MFCKKCGKEFEGEGELCPACAAKPEKLHGAEKKVAKMNDAIDMLNQQLKALEGNDSKDAKKARKKLQKQIRKAEKKTVGKPLQRAALSMRSLVLGVLALLFGIGAAAMGGSNAMVGIAFACMGSVFCLGGFISGLVGVTGYGKAKRTLAAMGTLAEKDMEGASDEEKKEARLAELRDRLNNAQNEKNARLRTAMVETIQASIDKIEKGEAAEEKDPGKLLLPFLIMGLIGLALSMIACGVAWGGLMVGMVAAL